MTYDLCNIKYIDLAKSKSEALVNIYILLERNIKSCIAKRRQQERKQAKKKSIGLNSKKTGLHLQHSFLETS